jgi:phosphatidylglycerol:prolipoprotein diacylglycerol transferase
MKYFYWLSAIILALVLVYFIFIPAFAGRLNIPPQIVFGNFTVRLYGITMAVAILVGYFVARKFAWKFGINHQEVDDFVFWITIVGLLGARIYYVIFDWQYFASNYSEIYKIWHGGLSIYGAIISGLLFILIYSRKKAYSVYQLLDLAALSLPLAQVVGRFGNFFNQEAYGKPTNLPWKMYVDIAHRPWNLRQFDFFHPTFFYEAIWDIIIFVILWKKLAGRVSPGILAFSYLGLYSIGRFFIESIRLDSSYIHGIKVDQITAVFGLLAAGLVIIWRQGIRQPKV